MAALQGSAMERYELEKWKCESYRTPATQMLVAATFAGTISLSVILAPGSGDSSTPGISVLAYASALFIGSIMGCILIIVSLEVPELNVWVTRITAGIVGVTLFAAFELLLLASSLFLHYRGPFIVGSILFVGFGVSVIVIIATSHIQARRQMPKTHI